MIDRDARNRLAELLRHLCSGAVDVDAYESEAAVLASNSQDQGIRAVFAASESLYDVDDGPLLRTSLFRKRRLTRMVRRHIARSIVFLHSDFEYGWPEDLRHPNTHGFAYLILSALIASAGLFVLFTSSMVAILCFVATASLFVFHQYHVWRIHKRWATRIRESTGLDNDFWPFRNKTEFDIINSQPRLLADRP
jgi:hypothetical protein